MRRANNKLFIFNYIKVFSFALVVCSFFSIRSIANDNILNFIHYTNKDGLPTSYVKSITQDRYGFIWLANRISVCRFDGKNFKEFPAFDESGKPYSLMCNRIFTCSDSIVIARTNDDKYFYFDFDNECFKPYQLLNNIGSVQSLEPTEGGFWICRDNSLYFLDIKTEKLLELREKVTFGNIPGNISFVNLKTNGDNLVATTENKLIIWFDFKKSKIKSFQFPSELESYAVSALYLDGNNNVWLGDEINGLFRLNLDNGSISHYSKDIQGDNHITHNLIHCFTEDHQGRVWIGTEAGICLWTPVTKTFTYSQYELSNPTGLNTDPIYNAFCDKSGNVWLGTYFGGINFWSAEKNFFKTWTSGIGNRQLGGNVVSCLKEDRYGNIWIGLEDLGVNKLDVTSGEITKYSSTSNENGLSYNNVHDLFFMADNTLWIGTYTGGINILNIQNGKYTHINRKSNEKLPSDNIYSFLPSGDSVFIATSNGVAIYIPNTNQLHNFFPDVLGGTQFEGMCKTKNKIWFSSSQGVYYFDTKKDSLFKFDRIPEFKSINFVKSDSKGRVWIGDCYVGLCYYDENSNKVVRYNKENGFPVSWMFSIEEGNGGWLWASSDKGLVRLNPEKNIFTLYDSNSGVPFNQFNFRASFKDSWGNIYFGGNNGMVSFNENENPDISKKMEIFLTGMQLFNKPVTPGRKSPLKKSINKVDKIKLDYGQNVFTIEFSALSYAYSGKCQYAYYLENFEQSWNYVGNRDFASYTNLSPGTYYFHVKGSVSNIVTEKEERILKIIVKPPFYLSIWAFIVYFIMVWVITIMVYMIGKRFEKSRAQVEIERREKVHADELHRVKLEFFTNISHELKTPLTLIIGPLNKILEEERLSPSFRKQLMGVEKNAQRLYHLISQLLEFRKIDDGKEVLQIVKCDLKPYTSDIRDSFEQIAENKNIDFKIVFPENDIPVWCDINKVDKIIFNLLSNAFKFTKEGGKIELKFDIVPREKKIKNSRYNLIIDVSDTGKGIEPEYEKRIFDRFFKVDSDNSQEKGTGIGLSYVKSLLVLHRGDIKVQSTVGVGTTFTVTLPVSKADYSKEELSHPSLQYIPSKEDVEIETESDDQFEFEDSNGFSHDPALLIVEDNHELLEFMKESLEEKYQIYTAKNGIEALEKLKVHLPDLIISDVMMPEMDGFEFTRRIKTDINTSHIPVILLTAKTGVENKLAGLKTGADFYIEKPFYLNVLCQNIENIINTRSKLIERFKNDVYVPVSEVTHSESDKVFIEKLTAIIKENISDPELDVTFLIKEMGVSRSLMHLKLKSLVDCSTTEFIRSIRLREAVKLISNGKFNISEAAYETGFSSPTYFTRRFKEYYGKSPREYFNIK
jgi:signal transduction histidine kinase/ligand-binding sensor domain-containing protein/DNA-binding response OmpR family regulator